MRQVLFLLAFCALWTSAAFSQNDLPEIRLEIETGYLSLGANFDQMTGSPTQAVQFALVDPYNFVILQELSEYNGSLKLTEPLVLTAGNIWNFQIIGISQTGNLVAISDVFEFDPPKASTEYTRSFVGDGDMVLTATITPWAGCTAAPDGANFVVYGSYTDSFTSLSGLQSEEYTYKAVTKVSEELRGTNYWSYIVRYGDIQYITQGNPFIGAESPILVQNGLGYGMMLHTPSSEPIALHFYNSAGQMVWSIANYTPGDTFWLPKSLNAGTYVVAGVASGKPFAKMILQSRQGTGIGYKHG